MLAIEHLGKVYPNGVNALQRYVAEANGRRFN